MTLTQFPRLHFLGQPKQGIASNYVVAKRSAAASKRTTNKKEGRTLFFMLVSFSFFLAIQLLPSSHSYAATWIYTVKSGDSLWAICAKYANHAMCWKELAEHNQLIDPNTLKPGMKIRLPIDWLKVKPAKASVVRVNGQVELMRQGSTEWQLLATNETLNIGDRLRTNLGNVTLRFADGSTLQALPSSIVVMDQLSSYEATGMVDTKIRLEKGRVRSTVKPLRTKDSHFRVTTPSAVAAVRGTVFRVGYETGADKPYQISEVLEGGVSVSAEGASQRIDEGFANVTIQGEAPKIPEKLLSPPAIKNTEVRSNRRFSFSWESIDGAKDYYVQLMEQQGNDYVLKSAVKTPANKQRFASLDLGGYRAIVNGISSIGAYGKESVHDFVMTDVIAYIELDLLQIPGVVPINQAFSINRPKPVDHLAEPGSKLVYQMSFDPGFEQIFHTEVDTGGRLDIPALKQGTYYIRYSWMTETPRVSDRRFGKAQMITVTEAKIF